jgi:hypothetical protein
MRSFIQYHRYYNLALSIRQFFVYDAAHLSEHYVLERHLFGGQLKIRQPTACPLVSGQQFLQRNVAPAPALGEGHVHGDVLRPGGEMTLPPERVQVVGYLEQCLLGEVFDVRSSTTAQSCSQPRTSRS